MAERSFEFVSSKNTDLRNEITDKGAKENTKNEKSPKTTRVLHKYDKHDAEWGSKHKILY